MTKEKKRQGGFALYAILNGVFILLSIFIMVTSFSVLPFMPSHENGMNSVFLIYTALWIPVTLLGCIVVANALISKLIPKWLIVLLCLIVLYIPSVFLFVYFLGAGEIFLVVEYVIFVSCVIVYIVFYIGNLVGRFNYVDAEDGEDL